MRNIMTGLAAAAIATAASTLSTSAIHGGFGGGGFARHPFFRERFAFRRFAFHRPSFGPQFAFYGGRPYAYSGSCYSRVWTPWGWRRRWACY